MPQLEIDPRLVYSESDFVPKLSHWKCLLSGSTKANTVIWRPAEGGEPNWFWRWMQYLCFGFRWIKDD